MKMPQSEVPEGMIKLAHALVETPGLRLWFCSLEQMPDWRRHLAFRRMAAKMQRAGEDRDLTVAIDMLAQPRVYRDSSSCGSRTR